MSADEVRGVKTRRLRLEGLGFLLLIVTLAMPGAASTARDDWQEIERIIAIGDVHGDYDNFLAVLKDAEVVNRRGKWVAGEAHVVQVGDLPDRGPDTLKIIRFLQKLEKQAVKAGGRLHLLIGNHEHMNITGDLRYVHPGEYKAFKTRNSPRLRDNYYAFVSEGLSRQRSELTIRVTCRSPTMRLKSSGMQNTRWGSSSIDWHGSPAVKSLNGWQRTTPLFASTEHFFCTVV